MNEITTSFYAHESKSFSATRQSAWGGWNELREFLPHSLDELKVLDIGCGNLRFEKFLKEQFPNAHIDVLGIDNCATLVDDDIPDVHVSFKNLDLVESLANCDSDAFLARLTQMPPARTPMTQAQPVQRSNPSEFDLVVAFGVMHHIPLPRWRKKFLKTLIEAAAPKGIIAVSFWQFMKSERIKRQAHKATMRAAKELGIELSSDEDDWMLGWQGKPGIYRYCHNYSDEEVSCLARSISKARPIAEFSADGSEGNLNRYIVFQRDVD